MQDLKHYKQQVWYLLYLQFSLNVKGNNILF